MPVGIGMVLHINSEFVDVRKIHLKDTTND